MRVPDLLIIKLFNIIVCVLSLWIMAINSLNLDSINTFKSHLLTHLFKLSYCF